MSSSLQALRHSTAEVLAYAVCDLFPEALLVDSVITEIGFHYDFIIKQPIDAQALPLIEERMRGIIKQNVSFKILDMMRENAVAFFLHHHQEIKADILAAFPENVVSIIQMEDFIDICPPSYLENTGEIGVFKLQGITHTSTYSEELGKIDVVRLHGTSFPDNYTLKRFLKLYESAKKCDHRQLGTELQLFNFHSKTGSNQWLPKGIQLCNTLLKLAQKEQSISCQPITVPTLLPLDLLPPKYKGRQKQIDGETYLVQPDGSLISSLMFKNSPPSELQLPIGYCTEENNYNETPVGQLCGFFKSRIETVPIDYIFCTQTQLHKELISSLQFIDKFIKIFGFEHQWYLNTKLPEGINKKIWNVSIDLLEQALKASELDYILDKEGNSIYGPRVEVGLADALGRKWRGPFIAIDMVHPERFDLKYQTLDGNMQKPAMITRSTFGSLGCFVAVLVEQYAGMLPLWLAPEQIRVIPVSPANASYAASILTKIEAEGFRGGVDYRPVPLGDKIHAAERERVPYFVIVGEREEKNCLITVRSCNKAEVQKGSNLESFLAQLHQDANRIGIWVESK
jgi:threonyl-tRNA synthetase